MTRPLPVGARRPAAPAPRAARPAPAPATDDTDDVLGGAFDEPEAPKPVTTSRPPAPATRRPAPARPAPVTAQSTAEQRAADIRRKHGTSGMPEAERIATGAKGSEVFGVPPSKSGSGPKAVVDTPQEKVAAGPRGERAPAPRRGPGDAVDLGPLDVVSKRPRATPSSAGFVPPPSVRDVDGAIGYIMETNTVPLPVLSQAQQQTRDYAFRLWVTDLLAKFDVISEVTSEARAMIGGPLVGEEEVGHVANAVAEMAAGAALRAVDTEADEEFGDGGPKLPSDDPTYIMPSGLIVTLEGLTDFVLRHVRAKSYTVQSDLDKQLGEGVSIGTTPGYKGVKNDNNTITKREKARKLARAILDALPQFTPATPAQEPTASDDPFDDGDGDDDGEVEGQTAQDEFEAAKRSLRARAEALVCEMCNYPSTHHKGLRGVGVKGTGLQEGNNCPGWQSASPEDEVALMVLVNDMEAFKQEWANFLTPPKREAADAGTGESGQMAVAPDVGQQRRVGATQPLAVGHRGDGAQRVAPGTKSGGVGSGAVGGGQPASSPVARGVARRTADDPEVERGESDGGDDTDPFAGQEGLGAGGGGGPDTGAEFTPAEFRANAEQVRREWAREAGGEFTNRPTWSINYPPRDRSTLPTTQSLALDQASVSRRERVTEWAEKYIGANFLDGNGDLRPDVEYGSPGWRAFVAARTLAKACEDYAANRHADNEVGLKRLAKRAADDYLAAHFILSDEVFDPDFGEYVDMCAEAKRPVGTPIAELMGLLE